MTATDKPARTRRRFPRPRTWRGWLGAGVGLVFAFVAAAWVLSRITPSWYAPLDPNETWVIDNAERTQNAFLDIHNVIQRVPLGEQKWSITQDEVNSFLAIRFAPPVNNNVDADTHPQLPAISIPCVAFEQGKVSISARASRIPGADPRGGVGTLVYSVGILKNADGNAQGLVRLSGAWMGMLPVPKSIVDSRLQAMVPAIMPAILEAIELQMNSRSTLKVTPDTQALIEAMMRGQPFPLRHTIDRKQLVITQIKVEEGMLSVVIAPPTPAAVLPRQVN